MTDANGVQTDKYVYNAWGKVVSSSGSTVNPYRYIGKYGYYYDTETNLYLLGKRYYDADAGMFCQRDEAKDGLSYYSYTSGLQMTAVDPWGRDWTTWDFVAYYEMGLGGTIDLADVGLLDEYQASVYSFTNDFEVNNFKRLTTHARTKCSLPEYQKKKGVTVSSGNAKLLYPSSGGEDISNSLYVIGGHSLWMTSSCHAVADCCNKTMTWSCHNTFTLNDRFEDPLSLKHRSWWKLRVTPPDNPWPSIPVLRNTPYDITAHWETYNNGVASF